MAATLAAPTVLAPRAAFSRAKKNTASTSSGWNKKGKALFGSSFATKTSSAVATTTRAMAGLGHTARQRHDGDPYDPNNAMDPAASQQHVAGSNVFHDAPPVPAGGQQNFADVNNNAVNARSPEYGGNAESQYFQEHDSASSPFVNPDSPSYLYEIESARVRYIELEARAVQERDYETASKSATHLERLVVMESEARGKEGVE